jgi:hypothetical protein
MFFAVVSGAEALGVGAPADPVARLQHLDALAGLAQLVRGGQAGGAGADDGDMHPTPPQLRSAKLCEELDCVLRIACCVLRNVTQPATCHLQRTTDKSTICNLQSAISSLRRRTTADPNV